MREGLHRPGRGGLPDHDRLYVAIDRDTTSQLQESVRDPARLDSRESKKIAHYDLRLDATTANMHVREDQAPYGARKENQND